MDPCPVPCLICELRSVDLEKHVQYSTGVKLIGLYSCVLDERASVYEDACHFGFLDYFKL